MIRRLGFGLSRELWMVEIGVLVNMLGYGAVLPFEVIYLHNGRGFSLGVAGLVVGTITGAAALAAPAAGALIDRHGARATASGAGFALAIGYAALAFADSPAKALAAAAVAGIGNGAMIPSQSTLLAALSPPQLRHRAAAVSRVATNAGIGFGGAVGGVVAAHGLGGFVALYLLNALTYVGYVCVLVAFVPGSVRRTPLAGGYRRVLRDRTFGRLALINVAMIGIGWGVLPWVLPPYAQTDLGVGARLIGLLFLANAATVVIAQVPIVRWAEGRRRVVMVAVAASSFAVACMLAMTAAHLAGAAYALLVGAAIVIGVGECFYSSALMPLVADLAPVEVRGRYMATIGLSWWIGLALAPTVGTQLLSISPAVAFTGAAGVAAVAGAAAMALEPALPPASRLTPRPQ